MIKVVLPSVWTAGGQTEFAAPEGPLNDVIKRFVTENPTYARRLLEKNGEPLTYVNIIVDDYLVPRQLRSTTTVEAGSTVTIIAPMAGG